MLSSMDTAEKIRENRVRRIAKRRGFRLEKSARRDERATDYGRYRLREVGYLKSEEPFELTLDQAERKLMGLGTFYRVGLGDHVDAERGSVITIKPGAVLDIAVTGQYFLIEGDGSLREVTGQRVEENADLFADFPIAELSADLPISE
jgi:hypothetical protein